MVRGAHLNGLDVTCHWRVLNKIPNPIAEPTNEDASLRPPTERDAPIIAKYGYEEQFGRAPFLGTTEPITYGNNSPVRKSKGKKLFPTRMQRPMVDIVEREQGGPNKSFFEEAWTGRIQSSCGSVQ